MHQLYEKSIKSSNKLSSYALYSVGTNNGCTYDGIERFRIDSIFAKVAYIWRLVL